MGRKESESTIWIFCSLSKFFSSAEKQEITFKKRKISCETFLSFPHPPTKDGGAKIFIFQEKRKTCFWSTGTSFSWINFFV